MVIKTRTMLNDVACDRVIFLVVTVITFLPQRTVIVSHEGSHWGAGGRKNSHRGPGGRELTEVTSMGDKKAAFDEVFFSKKGWMKVI